VPLRLAVTAWHRRIRLGETLAGGVRVGVSLLPTLVFTLVLAQILRERFAVPRAVFGGLIVYAVVNTMIPGFLLKVPLPEFEEPHAHELPPAEATAVGYVKCG
jgi:undecaprenyl pyrophosphate phosphatase UppP